MEIRYREMWHMVVCFKHNAIPPRQIGEKARGSGAQLFPLTGLYNGTYKGRILSR